MAQSRSSGDFLSTIRWKSLRDRATKALADLEGGGRDVAGQAEKRARKAITDLRAAADGLEKRFNIGGAGTRSKAAKKGAATRKAAAKKRSAASKKGAKKRTSSAKKR